MAAQPSITRIVNRAAVHLGTARRIASIDDGTPIASAARDVIDFVRDELLAEHPWNFAIRRAELAASVTVPQDWQRAFELPGDLIRWLPWAETQCDWRRCEREGAFLLSDADAPLPIRYIARIEDPSLWSPGFTAAIAAKLAMEIAPTVTGSDGIDTKMANRLLDAIARGKRQDGMETGDRRRAGQASSSWLAARGYSYGDRDGPYGPPIL